MLLQDQFEKIVYCLTPTLTDIIYKLIQEIEIIMNNSHSEYSEYIILRLQCFLDKIEYIAHIRGVNYFLLEENFDIIEEFINEDKIKQLEEVDNLRKLICQIG